MGFARVRQDIETYIKANWTYTPIHFDNVPFDIPADGKWIRVNIIPGTGFPETIGVDGYNLYVGRLSIAVFVPDNTGTATLLSYVDMLRDLFNRKKIGNVVFSAPSVVATMSPYEGYTNNIVDIPFWFIE